MGILEMEYEGVNFTLLTMSIILPVQNLTVTSDMSLEKFAFQTVLSALPIIDFRPDIIHCHDWQTGLIPVFKGQFLLWRILSRHQVYYDDSQFEISRCLGRRYSKDIAGISDYYFTPDKLRDYDDGNYLKGGIVYADMVTTVSDTYAEEIKTPFYGEGLDGLMRARSIVCGAL